MMDKVQKPCNSQYYTPSEPFRIYLKQLSLYLYIAKHHFNFSSETGTKHNNIAPDEDSGMEHAQPL
jgi:hypothetical protein